MASAHAYPEQERTDQAWHELDELAEEIARLATSELSASQFYAALLDRIVPVLAAVGGAVWTELPGIGLRLEHQVNLPDEQLAAGSDAQRRHARLVAEVLNAGSPRLVLPRSGPAKEGVGNGRLGARKEEADHARSNPQSPIPDSSVAAANPTEFLLVLCPWRLEEDSAGVIELLQRPGASPSAERGYLRLLSVVCELVTDFHRNRLVRTFQHRMERFGRFEHFVQQIHATLELKPTAYHIANEGRPLIGCDRLSVAAVRGSRCQVLAVSGVDSVNRRANVVRRLERLSKAAAAFGEPLWHPHQTDDLPPQIEVLLHEYLDVAHVRALAIIPVRAPDAEPSAKPRPVIGALIVEQFHSVFDDRLRETISAVLGHAGAALGSAVELENVPMLRLWRALGKAGWLLRVQQLPKTLLGLLAVAGVVTALATVPADFDIQAPGELRPLASREIFAPYDGVVDDLPVKHGSHVRSGQALVQIRSPQLDFQFERVLGELATVKKRLAAVEAERLQSDGRQTDDQRRRYGQVTAEEEEIRESISSLEKQQAVLEEQRSKLKVASPIDGQVLTWDLQQLLEARPVARGQILMTVADPRGPWGLELHVPDHRVAHVLEARRRIGPDLDVSFVLASSPDAKLRGKLDRVGIRTEVAEKEDAFVLAAVTVDRDQIPELIPGATVAAKIHCGRRPVGYVWLRDLIEAVQMWFLF